MDSATTAADVAYPYQLKAAVTSLKITKPPRTVYKRVVKKLPSDLYSSETSGRTFSQEAPLPVENLAAHALTKSSIQIEGGARSADGILARILQNDTLIQERGCRISATTLLSASRT